MTREVLLIAIKNDSRKILERYFGYTSFFWQQENVIDCVLAKKHAIVIAPTGIGKSLCYQVPAVMCNDLTVVISPLISLMKDQVDSLLRRGIEATYINSTLSRNAREARYSELEQGSYRILYVTPERFRKPDFVHILSGRMISLLAVDEAHCISEWGHDFRPDYTRLKEIRQLLGNPVTIALTATATPVVQKDIIDQLGLKPDDVKTFHGGIDRPNLSLQIEEVFNDDEKLDHILCIADKYKGSGIVYFTLIKTLDAFGELLSRRGIPHFCYHGNLEAAHRSSVHEQFMQEKDTLVLATNAFGMGIDKKDIRFVIHADIPGSIESYYQEIGRAGRDGKHSLCALLYNENDLLTQMEFIRWNNPDAEYYQRVHSYLSEDIEKISALGIDWFKRKLHSKNCHDYRLETALKMLDRYGVIECADDIYKIRVLSSLPPQLLDRNYLENKHRNDLQKLYKLVQYVKHTGNRKLFIKEYFGIKDLNPV
ncbi:MAG: ATP-dependent DNA helicase RecQ [Candidatus Kuenenia sp.]|nr:ATP-dependent DNA helicase RecQ [Candidatus Kuenenia hertensis]